MHPISQDPRRLGFYFLSWVPVIALLVVILVTRQDLTVGEGFTIGSLLGLIYSLIGFPVWYVCKANPLRGTAAARSLATHLIAAVLYAFVLLVSARLVAAMTETAIPEWIDLSERLGRQAVLIFFAGVLIYLLNAGFYYILLEFDRSREAERQQTRLEVLAGQAELRALKMQVNPHFLFNSLNSISALTTGEPKKAREMCIRLADFLRKSLGMGDKGSIALKDEIALLEDYLAVEKIRLGERLQVDMTVGRAARLCRVPPLLLQPLVENAVLHGVATLTEGGTLRLTADRTEDRRLRIEVENPFDPEAPRRPGSGVGMNNVRRRLHAHFGGDGRMEVESKGGMYRVVVSMPAEIEEE